MIFTLLFFAIFSYGAMANQNTMDCELLQREVHKNLTLFLEIEQRLQEIEEALENSPKEDSEDNLMLIRKNLVIFFHTEKQLKQVEQNLQNSQEAYQECLAT